MLQIIGFIMCFGLFIKGLELRNAQSVSDEASNNFEAMGIVAIIGSLIFAGWLFWHGNVLAEQLDPYSFDSRDEGYAAQIADEIANDTDLQAACADLGLEDC